MAQMSDDFNAALVSAEDDASLKSSDSLDSYPSDESEDELEKQSREEAIREAENLITSLESDVPEHLREIVVARANDACSLARSGKSPEKAICDAMKAIRCMNSSNGPCTKVKLLNCALERIRGNGGGFLKRVSNEGNACAAKKKKKEYQKRCKQKDRKPC